MRSHSTTQVSAIFGGTVNPATQDVNKNRGHIVLIGCTLKMRHDRMDLPVVFITRRACPE